MKTSKSAILNNLYAHRERRPSFDRAFEQNIDRIIDERQREKEREIMDESLHRYDLSLHITVDWRRNQLFGIAIQQQVLCITTGEILDQGRPRWYKDIDSTLYTTNTRKQAHLTAVLHAFRHARMWKTEYKDKIQTVRLQIWHSKPNNKKGVRSPNVVSTIEHFIKNPDLLYPEIIGTKGPFHEENGWVRLVDRHKLDMHRESNLTIRKILGAKREMERFYNHRVWVSFHEKVDDQLVAGLMTSGGAMQETCRRPDGLTSREWKKEKLRGRWERKREAIEQKHIKQEHLKQEDIKEEVMISNGVQEGVPHDGPTSRERRRERRSRKWMNRMIRRGVLMKKEDLAQEDIDQDDGNYEPGVVIKQEDVEQEGMVEEDMAVKLESEEHTGSGLCEATNWTRSRCTIL